MLLAISANDIDTAGHAVDAVLPVAWLEDELSEASVTATAPGHVTGRLSRSGNDVVVRAKVKVSLTLPCARCLDPSPLDVDTELSLLLRPAPPAPRAAAKGAKGGPRGAAKGGAAPKPKPKPDDEYEFSAAEADTDTFDGDTVVLDPFIREAVLLELPNFPLCSDSCPGIRPAPQHDGAGASDASGTPPLDPRLAPLAALRLNGSGSPRVSALASAPAVSKKTKKKE